MTYTKKQERICQARHPNWIHAGTAMLHRETHGTSLCFSAAFFLSAAIEGFL